MDELGKTLTQLLNQVSTDPNLDDDDKEDLLSLINDVVASPTPNNIEALSIVIEELGKSQEYEAAKEILANYAGENEAVLQEPEAEASVPEAETPAPVADLSTPAADTPPVVNSHDAMSPSELPQVPPMEVPPAETPVQQ